MARRRFVRDGQDKGGREARPRREGCTRVNFPSNPLTRKRV